MKTSLYLLYCICYLYHALSVNSQECTCVPYDACNYDYSLKENASNEHETLFILENGTRPSCISAIDVCCDRSSRTTSQPLMNDKQEELSINNSNCGYRGKHSDNVNENADAEFGEFPWMVAVLKKEYMENEQAMSCISGGTLINDQAVLTAAYDIDKLSSADLIVRVGQYQNFYQDIRVKGIYKHPNFDKKSLAYNYAVLILAEPVNSQAHIKPICLPTSSNTYELIDCIETGWGPNCNVIIQGKGTLKRTYLNIRDYESCKKIYYTSNMNDKNRNNKKANDYQYNNYNYNNYGYNNYGYDNRYGYYGYGNRYGGGYRYRRDNYQNDYGNLDKSIICAADRNFKTPCTGNGGSPLICPLKNDRRRYVQVGIAMTAECKDKRYKSGLYANVIEAKPWIDQMMIRNNLPTETYVV